MSVRNLIPTVLLGILPLGTLSAVEVHIDDQPVRTLKSMTITSDQVVITTEIPVADPVDPPVDDSPVPAPADCASTRHDGNLNTKYQGDAPWHTVQEPNMYINHELVWRFDTGKFSRGTKGSLTWGEKVGITQATAKTIEVSSRCGGIETNWPCRQSGTRGTLSWVIGSHSSGTYCELDPNKTYYINIRSALDPNPVNLESRYGELCLAGRNCGATLRFGVGN